VNALPTVGVEVLEVNVMVGELTALTVKASVADPVPAELLALIVTLVAPAAVGVPEITPLVVLIDNPAGKPVALKLVGLLLAAIT
jgi:hypothetical protein